MHVINSVLGDARGGRWQVLVDYSSWLREEGHKVSIVIESKANEDTKDLEAMGCTILRLRNSGFYDPFGTLGAYRLLKKLDPEIVLAHDGRSSVVFKRASTLIKTTVPIVAINHSNNVKRTLGADAFLNISDHIEQLVKSKSRSKIHYRVINCPRQINSVPPRKRANAITKLRYMGQLIDRKGVDVLLRALSILKQQQIQFELKIAGRGDQEQPLKQLTKQLGLEKDVTFIGHTSSPIDFLSSGDIFCFPSLGEGFPISPIEAFAAGCAVIGTDDPGTAELLERGDLGLIAPRGDAGAFAQALKKLMQNEPLRQVMAQKGYSTYLAKYTPANAKRVFIAALYDVLARSK